MIFERIVIGDWDVGEAEAPAGELDDPRVEALKADAQNTDEPVRALCDLDVVMNGLPWKYDCPAPRACGEAGVHGLDVASEGEPWSLDAEAKKKGLIVVPGVGATSGITNMMARSAAGQPDEVSRKGNYDH